MLQFAIYYQLNKNWPITATHFHHIFYATSLLQCYIVNLLLHMSYSLLFQHRNLSAHYLFTTFLDIIKVIFLIHATSSNFFSLFFFHYFILKNFLIIKQRNYVFLLKHKTEQLKNTVKVRKTQEKGLSYVRLFISFKTLVRF